MFEVYALVWEKTFTIDALAQEELGWDWFHSKMSPEQRDFYLRAAQEIGAREAARYAGEDARALAAQLGVEVYEAKGVGSYRPCSGPYAEYDSGTRMIMVHERGIRDIAILLHQRVRHLPSYRCMDESMRQAILDTARDLLVAHELFHHLEATTLGPAHRMLPPMSLSFLGDFWKIKRYVKRTREIAAHSFAFTLLRIEERFPCAIEQTSHSRDIDRG